MYFDKTLIQLGINYHVFTKDHANNIIAHSLPLFIIYNTEFSQILQLVFFQRNKVF